MTMMPRRCWSFLRTIVKLAIAAIAAFAPKPSLAQDSAEQADAPKVVEEGASTVAKASRETDQLDRLVLVGRGELPVLISAPHGGQWKIKGVEPRTGEGMAQGPSGFFTGRDGGTEELAKALVDEITKRTGKAPYFVISATHRRYLDPNRPPEIAFEDEDAKPVYERYHGSCAEYCRDILTRFRTGVLLDLHGQGTSAGTVYRGTQNGKTNQRLRERFGDLAIAGDESLFGLLKREGWTVFPDPLEGKEQAGFTGGYIVKTHGSLRADGLDAYQLEFGAQYRSVTNRAKTAEQLTNAVIRYLDLYASGWDQLGELGSK